MLAPKESPRNGKSTRCFRIYLRPAFRYNRPMKAIRVESHGGPEVLTPADVPEPQPGEKQLLVRVKAVGVNPVDTYIRAGIYGPTNLPYTPGFDAAGVVEQAGPGVTRFAAGDRVYTSKSASGTYAELTVCPEEGVHPLPQKVSFTQGAALGIPYATAYRALFQKARAQAGETVLIHGATGGVGLAAVQFAKAAGLHVIGTGGTPKGRELVQENGADHILDHGASNYTDEIMRLTDGRGVDVIIEMLANVNLGKDLQMLAKFGRVVVVGSRGNVEITPRDLMRRDSCVMGMTLFNAPPDELEAIYQAINEGLDRGALNPLVGHELPLSDAARAHVMVMESGAYGKIVLLP